MRNLRCYLPYRTVQFGNLQGSKPVRVWAITPHTQQPTPSPKTSIVLRDHSAYTRDHIAGSGCPLFPGLASSARGRCARGAGGALCAVPGAVREAAAATPARGWGSGGGPGLGGGGGGGGGGSRELPGLRAAASEGPRLSSAELAERARSSPVPRAGPA